MKLKNKNEFLIKSNETLGEIFDILINLPSVNLNDLVSKETALVIVDMVNGFAKEGALMSPLIGDLIPGIVKLSKECDLLGIQKIAFADSHPENSPEFNAYPIHCLQESGESEIVDEIKVVGEYLLIQKNSTNGFHEDDFRQWLIQNAGVKNFIITGDCTDICVQQFAITLKTYFNQKNQECRVIVPLTHIDTYDFGVHNANLTNVMACYNMIINGVEVVTDII